MEGRILDPRVVRTRLATSLARLSRPTVVLYVEVPRRPNTSVPLAVVRGGVSEIGYGVYK